MKIPAAKTAVDTELHKLQTLRSLDCHYFHSHRQGWAATVKSVVMVDLARSRNMCELRMLHIISSDDEEGEHNVLNLFLDVVKRSSPGMQVERFLENEELARTALSCHLAVDLLCQEMQAAW